MNQNQPNFAVTVVEPQGPLGPKVFFYQAFLVPGDPIVQALLNYQSEILKRLENIESSLNNKTSTQEHVDL